MRSETVWNGDIITNPPFKFATEFVLTALRKVPEGNKVAMFLRVQFLESMGRYEKIFSQYKPIKVYAPVKRLQCADNGDFIKYNASCTMYSWFVWEKGNYNETKIEWINY